MKRILVVDDERDITFTIKQVLKDQYEIEAVNDSISALAGFEAGKYDLVVMDVSMPKMNGFDFCRELKKKDRDVKVLIITALEMANYAPYTSFRREFPDFQDWQVMRKPFGIDELTERIEKVIGS